MIKCKLNLKEQELNNLNNFEYKSKNESISYNYIISPALNKVVEYIPNYIAPNLLTAISLFCNFISAIFVYKDSQFDYYKELSTSTLIIAAITHLLYIILDNLDGKQARKTKNSSPFGLLMDHGCDVFTTIFTGYTFSHVLLLGNDNFFNLTVFYGLYIGFFAITYEECINGFMFFGKISAVDDGNLILPIFYIFIAITGNSLIKYKIFNFMSLGQFLGLAFFLIGFFSIIQCIVHIYREKGSEEVMNIPKHWIFFTLLMLYPIILLIINPFFFSRESAYFMPLFSLIFASIILDMHIDIITVQSYSVNISNILFVILIYISLLLFGNDCRIYLVVILILVAIYLAIIIVVRGNQILNFLGLRLFCVKDEYSEGISDSQLGQRCNEVEIGMDSGTSLNEINTSKENSSEYKY